MSAVALGLYGLFLAYFVLLHAGQVVASLLALPTLKRELGLRALQDLPRMYSGFEPPVSLLVVAREREGDIVASVQALLGLDYPEYEVLVVNDGSGDATLAALVDAFHLEAFPEVYWRRLGTRPVRAIYHSRSDARLRVIDKEHGGRADALNAGINASRYPLFCAVDAAVTLHPQGLRRLVAPFLDDPATVAAGGAVRMANGCTLSGGKATAIALPASLAGCVQLLVELRALFGAMGRARLNAELLLAGALVVFRKDIVVETGGHAPGTLDERAELVCRLHRVLRERRERYAVRFVPETAGWRTAPETLAALESPRMREQYALVDSLDRNSGLAQRRGGAAGWIAWPFLGFFEGLGPLIEVAAVAFIVAMVALGQLGLAHVALFLGLAFALGLLTSAAALAIEDSWFHQYPAHAQLARLAGAAVVENLVYRPMASVWRAAGTLAWMRAKAVARRAARRA